MSSTSSSAQATSGSSLSSQSSPSSHVSTTNNPSTPPPATNSPTQTSVTNASTTASPTAPTTTSQSSPTPTSSVAAQTTASSSSTTTSSPTSFTSQVPTTFSSTDPGGSIVYVTSTVPEVFTTSVSSGTSSSSSSNTGVIVGAVVGGVAGLVILVLLLFCIRKRVRKDEFDGNFDPDRVVGHADGVGATLPHVDLADEVTPFPQSYSDQSSMRQYGKSPYIPVPSSLAASGHASTEFYPPGAVGAGASAMNAQPRPFVPPGAGPPPPGAYVPPVNMYGAGPPDWHSPRPGVSPPPSTVSNNTSSTRAAKEREAMGRSGQGVGLGLATQQEAAEGSGDVVVHQDAGRAPAEDHAPPREIPPAYESIRQD